MTEITKGNQLVCLYTHTKICERRNGIQAFSQYWLMWIWEKIKWDRNWHPHKAGVRSLRDLTPDGLRWGPQPPGSDAWCSECSWCNKSRNQVHGKCHVLESPWNLGVCGKIGFHQTGLWFQKRLGNAIIKKACKLIGMAEGHKAPIIRRQNVQRQSSSG